MLSNKALIAGITLAAALAAAPSRAQVTVAEIEGRYPECAGLFTQAHLDALAASSEDPEEAFRNWRLRHVAMAEESRAVRCQVKAWRFLHGTGTGGTAPSVTSGAVFAPRTPVRSLFAAAAKLSANVPAAGGVEQYQGETFIAVNPNDPLEMVAGANTDYHDLDPACQSPVGASKTLGTQALYGSTDGGKTWVYRCAPWHPSVVGGLTGAWAWYGSDPSLAWDANGNAYAAYMLISQKPDNDAGVSIVIAKSSDSGSSWTPHGVVVNNIASTTAYDDKEMLAIDTSSGGVPPSYPGRMYVIWSQNAKIHVSRSTDGMTWSTPKMLSSAPGVLETGGNITVGPDGTVYAVWNRVSVTGGPGLIPPDKMMFSKSTSGGIYWSTPKEIFAHALPTFDSFYAPQAQKERGINAFASIDVDRNFRSDYYGRVYLAWSDLTYVSSTGNHRTDIQSAWSDDNGITWSVPVNVNDDDGRTHILPWLAVDQSDGTVHVAWYDTRNDLEKHQKTQVYTARSSSGGATWSHNLNLTDGGVNLNNQVNYLDLSNAENANQYGEYLGIAAANRKVFAFFTDSRQFVPDFTNSPEKEDATAAVLTYCAPPSFPRGFALEFDPEPGTLQISWTAISNWGTGALSGTYRVQRFTGSKCLGTPTATLDAGPDTWTLDSPPASGTYAYRVMARNSCPGTDLTPMTAFSPCFTVSYLKL
jgi:hypothetical protein